MIIFFLRLRRLYNLLISLRRINSDLNIRLNIYFNIRLNVSLKIYRFNRRYRVKTLAKYILTLYILIDFF